MHPVNSAVVNVGKFSGHRLRVGARVAAALCLAPGFAASAVTELSAPAGDKSQYNLFHPTPDDLLRPMSTDRPDLTESAFTVDAGHFQVEWELVGAVLDRDRSGGGNVQTTGWGTSLNLKAGLLNNVDLQLVIDPYVSVKTDDRGTSTTTRDSALADFQTRLKINLWGNDGGTTALGIMPFIKWPLPETSLRNGKTEGGVIVPLAVALPHDWSATVMTEFDFVSADTGGYGVEYFNTITCGHNIVGPLGGYVEFAALLTPTSGADWQGQANLGFTYSFTANTQLDWGCNFGVTGAAPDFNPFLGFSYRF